MACIRIEREGEGFEVSVTNPERAKKNTTSAGEWTDPEEDYQFDTWDQVKEFLDRVVDKALPPDEYNQAFAKFAKEAMNEQSGD